jgi:hypothetical protein
MYSIIGGGVGSDVPGEPGGHRRRAMEEARRAMDERAPEHESASDPGTFTMGSDSATTGTQSRDKQSGVPDPGGFSEYDPANNKLRDSASTGKRINVTLSDEAYAELGRLARAKNRTMSSVMRLALSLAKLVLRLPEGQRLAIVDKDDNIRKDILVVD